MDKAVPNLPNNNPDGFPLVDSYGRFHNNLRISVTDRCNLRCVYCMPEEVEFLDRDELLTFEEITEFARVAVGMGIDKIRLTGGEPLLRKNLFSLVNQLAQIHELKDLSLTTNGLLLREQARELKAAGLSRITVSLDTLRKDRFREICRRDGLELVLQGLDKALEAGFQVKLNSISMKDFTEDEVVELAAFARGKGLEIRFIEYMPIGANPWEREKVFLAHEILAKLEEAFGSLNPSSTYDPKAPAMEFEYADGKGKVGIIASVSRPFCKQCNRIRLTAEGKLRNCLFSLDETDIKPYLRPGINQEAIKGLIQSNIWAKWEGHEINSGRFVKPLRTMHAIGG